MYPAGNIYGIYDPEGMYLYNTVYDIKSISYNPDLSVNWFLKLQARKDGKKIIDNFLDEFELGKEILKRKLKTLSSSELLKVLIIKVCLINTKAIILDNIDHIFSWKDLNNVLKVLRKYAKDKNKTILFQTNNIDNMIIHIDKYIVIKDEHVIFSGSDFDSLPVLTETTEFSSLANQRGADLAKYKEPSDLLKAIYRSVKR